MSHGGSRVGSGRKPKGDKPSQPVPFVPLVGGKRQEVGAISAIPPEDLPQEQREFWHLYAQRAIEQGTLTVNTVAAFRLLCQSDAIRQRRAKKIEDEGETYVKVTVDGSGQEHQEYKAHPLTGPHD